MTCKEITALATDFAEGHLPEARRAELVSHVASCRGCATFARQLQAAALAAGALPPPELPAALRAELLARFDAWVSARAAAPPVQEPAAGGRLSWAPALAALGLFATLVGLARRPSGSVAEWATAAALALLAAGLAAALRRLTLGAVAVAAAPVLLAAVATGGQGTFDHAGGVDCLAAVGGAAVAASGIAWAARRGGVGALLRIAPLALAGALTGVAALQVTCPAHRSLAHLLGYHLGGFLLVAAAVLLWGRPRIERA